MVEGEIGERREMESGLGIGIWGLGIGDCVGVLVWSDWTVGGNV